MSERMRPENRESERIIFSVREAAASDAARIAEIHLASWAATYPNEEAGISEEYIRNWMGDTKMRAVTRAENIEKELLKDSVRTFVVCDGDLVVGFSRALKQDSEGFVHSLYLDPEYAGKGAGAKLFQDTLAWLGESKPVGLEVATYNTTAIKFYKKFEFEETEEFKKIKIGADKLLPVRVMLRPAAAVEE